MATLLTITMQYVESTIVNVQFAKLERTYGPWPRHRIFHAYAYVHGAMLGIYFV